MVKYWAFGFSHFIPSTQVITFNYTASHTIYMPSIAYLMYSLESFKSIPGEMSKPAPFLIVSVFMYDMSPDPAAHVIGS